MEMGMEALIDHSDNIEIPNESSFELLFKTYTNKLNITPLIKRNSVKSTDPNQFKLKDLIIIALYGKRHNEEKDNFYSTTEICNIVSS